MKMRVLLAGLALALAAGPAAAAEKRPPLPKEALCQVVDIIDGDTIKCFAPQLDQEGISPLCRLASGEVIQSCWPIRLLRIDTGETTCIDKKCERPRWTCEKEYDIGMAAKARMRQLVDYAGGIVILTKIQYDRYPNRRDAEVEARGINFSQTLLDEKLAVAYKGTAAQRKAKLCASRAPYNVLPPSPSK